MQPMLEKFGLTVLVALVATMFLSMFAGYMIVGQIAIAAFTVLGAVMTLGQMREA
jgi:hypothetical protein